MSKGLFEISEASCASSNFSPMLSFSLNALEALNQGLGLTTPHQNGLHIPSGSDQSNNNLSWEHKKGHTRITVMIGKKVMIMMITI